MSFLKKITKPFKELGQEVLKVGTTVSSAGTLRYDEDQGFKEGFVTKTALKETGKIINNAASLVQANPQLVDAAGMYLGVPNASSFLDKKEVPLAPKPTVVQTEYIQPPQANNQNMILIVGGLLAAVFIFLMVRKK